VDAQYDKLATVVGGQFITMSVHLCVQRYDHKAARRAGYEKGYKIWKMGWFGVVMGHSRSRKIAPFNTAHTSSC